MSDDETLGDDPFGRLFRSIKMRKIEDDENKNDSDYVPNDLENLFEEKAKEQTQKKSPRKSATPKEKKVKERPYISNYIALDNLDDNNSIDDYSSSSSSSDVEEEEIPNEEEEIVDEEQIIDDDEEGDEIILNSDDTESQKSIAESPIQIIDESDDGDEDDDYCFACDWADYSELDGEDVNIMLRMIDEGFMKCDNKYLSKNVNKYYELYIYRQMREKGVRIKKWSKKSIQNHIEQHIKDPKYYIGRMIMMYEKIMRYLNSQIAVTVIDPNTGITRTMINTQAIKLIMDIEKRTTDLLKADPKKMNFYNEKCTLDFQNLGKLINPNNFKLAKNKR
jgi:hypothetical protein